MVLKVQQDMKIFKSICKFKEIQQHIIDAPSEVFGLSGTKALICCKPSSPPLRTTTLLGLLAFPINLSNSFDQFTTKLEGHTTMKRFIKVGDLGGSISFSSNRFTSKERYV
jgi:hypothetical protein